MVRSWQSESALIYCRTRTDECAGRVSITADQVPVASSFWYQGLDSFAHQAETVFKEYSSKHEKQELQC